MNSEMPSPPFADQSVQRRPVRREDGSFPAVDYQSLLLRLRYGLRERWWIIPISLLLISGWPIYRASTQPAKYGSQAVIWMDRPMSLPLDYSYSENLTTYLETQGDLLQSTVIRERACRRVANRFPTIPVEIPGDRARPPFDVKVKTSLRSSVLQLHASGPTPESTRYFLNALMEEYLDFKREFRDRACSNALMIITTQLEKVAVIRTEQQRRIADFQKSNNLSYVIERAQKAGSYLAPLRQSLSVLRTEHRLGEMLLAETSPSFWEDLPALPAGEATPQERDLAGRSPTVQTGYYEILEKLHLLKSKRDDLSRYLRPVHSKMVKLEQDIIGLEKLLSLLKAEGVRRMRSELAIRQRSLELRIQNLESQHQAWQTDASEAAGQLAAFEAMQQEMQHSQSLYERLLALRQSLDLNKVLAQEAFTPLAAASVARPAYSDSILAGFAAIFSLLIGLGLILFLEFINWRLMTLHELRTLLSVDVAGQVPEHPRDGARFDKDQPIKARHAFLAALRNLRSWLLLLWSESAERPRILLVSSAIPGEGKTTVAANLAALLAAAGQRVLLIDADCRGPALHRLFKANRAPGLGDVLSRSAALKEAVVPTAQAGMHLLPAGEIRGYDAEPFLGDAWPELLRELTRHYDYLLIDSAPVLTSDAASSLGLKTDGVLMVVRAAFTPAPIAQEALDRLRQRRIKVLGLVLNRAPVSLDYNYRYSHFNRQAPFEMSLPALVTEGGSKVTGG